MVTRERGVRDRESHGNAKKLEPEQAVQVKREAGVCGYALNESEQTPPLAGG